MKTILAAAWAGVMLCGAALAQSMAGWTAPDSQFSFQRPAGWPVDRISDSSPAVSHYAAGLAAAECNFYGVARADSAALSPANVRNTINAPFTAAQWAQVATSIRSVRGAAPQDLSVDASGPWPIQRAVFQRPDGPVYAAVTARPGLEIWAFCQSFDGRERAEIFTAIIRSIATPRDAEWAAAAPAQ